MVNSVDGVQSFGVHPVPNRLAKETSPYLLQHASNPVDWFPWGTEAFEKAKREDKPIFLSVGYSTCHWCHVMEHESFVDPKVAAYLNEHFVSIKVDREERPDVDHVYMTFVQATSGRGGWPMSVWLTPELNPFLGGTYFGPIDHPGRPGFLTVLTTIQEQWKTRREKIEERGRVLIKALEEAGEEADSEVTSASSAEMLLADGIKFYSRTFDAGNGGFGGAPKFPRCVNQEFLLFAAVSPLVSEADRRMVRGMALHTLQRMGRGGMYDHIGGGFHRYSVDERWHVPHFEKMLYDQAQLVSNYAAACLLGAGAESARLVNDTLTYVSTLLSKGEGKGGFYSAEDADSYSDEKETKKKEGAFYVWEYKELVETLGADRARFYCALYDVKEEGNVPEHLDPHEELVGKNVLMMQDSVASVGQRFGFTENEVEKYWEECRAVLLARRGLRPRPHLDDKVLTSWNGLMIAAYAQAYRALGDEGHLRVAQTAMAFLKSELFDSTTGELWRSYRQGKCEVRGFATDYAGMIHGLIELYAADFDIQWLSWALDLQAKMDALFWDDLHFGYYSTTDRDPSILLRMKEDYDGAEPTPNSLAARNLWHLGHLLNKKELLERGRKTVDEFRARLQKQVYGMPLMVVNAVLFETPAEHVILHADGANGIGLSEMVKTVHATYRPWQVVMRIASPVEREFFAANGTVAGLPAEVKVTAYVCKDYACQLPVTDSAELAKLMK